MPEKRKRVGRPKFAKGEARDVVLQSRVQASEKTSYQKAAKAKGVDLSTWIRETLNAATK